MLVELPSHLNFHLVKIFSSTVKFLWRPLLIFFMIKISKSDVEVVGGQKVVKGRVVDEIEVKGPVPDFGVSTAIMLSCRQPPYVVQVEFWTLAW